MTEKLMQLFEMGLTNSDTNKAALSKAKGNLEMAIDLIYELKTIKTFRDTLFKNIKRKSSGWKGTTLPSEDYTENPERIISVFS